MLWHRLWPDKRRPVCLPPHSDCIVLRRYPATLFWQVSDRPRVQEFQQSTASIRVPALAKENGPE